MTKRKKWTKKEDKLLKKYISLQDKEIIWKIISHKLKKEGIQKTSKQCSERWTHHLDPSVKKKKWTKSENNKLFNLFKIKRNKWKMIAHEFEGRTHNCVKNKFFCLIRKSLRIICKLLRRKKNSEVINQIKASVLIEFLKEKIFFDFRGNKSLEDIDEFYFENFDDEFFLENCKFRKSGDLSNNLKNKTNLKNKNNYFSNRKFLGKINEKNNNKDNSEIYLQNISEKKTLLENNFDKDIALNLFNKNFKKKKFINDKMQFKNYKKFFEIEIYQLIKKLAFTDFIEVYEKMNKKDIFILKKILANLFQLNDDKNNINFNISKTSIFSENDFSDESNLEKNENIINSDNSRIKKIKKIKSEKVLSFYSKNIYQCFQKEKHIKKKYQNNFSKLKKHLISNFQKIKNFSEIILEKIPKSSDSEIKLFYEKIIKENFQFID